MSTALAPRAPPLCCSCGVGVSRYTCPRCAARYCCAGCCQAHRLECAPKAPPTPAAAPLAAAADDDAGDEDATRVPAERLARLSGDARIAAALGDPRLRRVLRTLDAAPDRVAALELLKRREGAPFAAFCDDVLRVLGEGGT